MTNFDPTSRGVLYPGAGNQYFDVHAAVPFDVKATAFRAINAWWLAELSRLSYRHGADEVPNPVLPTRATWLERVGLKEKNWFRHEHAQVAFVEAREFDVLVFRGTDDPRDWMKNLDARLIPWPHGGEVHSGFASIFKEVKQDVLAIAAASRRPLFVTGHSLGGALATLATSVLIANGRAPRATYTFGAPRCGNGEFCDTVERVPFFRIVNNRDLVANVPLATMGYRHAGELHYIESDGDLAKEPSMLAIKRDHLRDDPTSDWTPDMPPEHLSDHSPVNYVAWLERIAKR
ncbi:MAG TPA: lipase family protein [Thermoanaerobaculia bacterium]|jgi:hypothetical protein